MELIAVISIIIVAMIAIDRWFAKQARDLVKLIEQIGEDQKLKEEKLRRHLERIEKKAGAAPKREEFFEMHPSTEKIIEKYLEEHSEGGDTNGEKNS